jgi:hypothetical protein
MRAVIIFHIFAMILRQGCRSPRNGSGAPQRRLPTPLLQERCVECWPPAPVERRVDVYSSPRQRPVTVKEGPGHGPTEPRRLCPFRTCDRGPAACMGFDQLRYELLP